MTREETVLFYREHYRRIFNISLRIVRNSADAEEIMQDTILRYMTSAPAGLSEKQVSAWLARTAIRMSIDRLRAIKKEAEVLEEPHENEIIDEAEEERWRPDPDTILRKIRALPDPYRLVVNLVLIEGLDYQEISDYTGIKETTLRSHYSRGLAKLRLSLK